MALTLEVLPDARAATERAADFIAARVREAAASGRAVILALSGGETGEALAAALRTRKMPLDQVWLLQVDERVAPRGHADRNLTRLQRAWPELATALRDRLLPMPVEHADLERAATDYAETLASLAGRPPRIDIVHLGLGEDGHTASLVPGDPVLNVEGADVAVTREYRGRRRLTLTFPVLARARCLVWLVCGPGKASALARLVSSDPAIPAGRVATANAILFADAPAAAAVPHA